MVVRAVSTPRCQNRLTGVGFALGGAHSPYYDGQTLADKQDVVVVTFKYVTNQSQNLQ